MEIATLLTAFAALLTSIVTMFTVLEMRRQRVVSHLPILKILGEYAQVEIDQNQNWMWKSESLLINNYGKGVALDVSVKWEVEIEPIVEMLKKYDPHNVKDFSLENGFLKLDNSFHAVDRQSEANFPALPINTQTSNKLRVPPYLTTAFEKYIAEAILNRPKTNNSKVKSFDLEDFPAVNIKASYKDINENEYVKNFSLQISISSVRKGSENKNGAASIIFDVKEADA